MSLFTAHITIMPLTELLDPQGKAVMDTLHKLDFAGISNVRIGKQIVLSIEAADAEEAHVAAELACKKMLYNPVMEQYSISVV
jgi:phosphoribosylformylglycinamidine synthase subunit PurS